MKEDAIKNHCRGASLRDGVVNGNHSVKGNAAYLEKPWRDDGRALRECLVYTTCYEEHSSNYNQSNCLRVRP
jgi:hypothetical protein